VLFERYNVPLTYEELEFWPRRNELALANGTARAKAIKKMIENATEKRFRFDDDKFRFLAIDLKSRERIAKRSP